MVACRAIELVVGKGQEGERRERDGGVQSSLGRGGVEGVKKVGVACVGLLSLGSITQLLA